MPAMIHHRINTLAQLSVLADGRGAEVDLRSDVGTPGALHLSHDAFVRGEPFLPWLDAWSRRPRGTLLLNTKEDGLEAIAMDACQARGIDDVIFLDTQLPTLVRLSAAGWGPRLALRLSAYEPAEGLSAWRQRPRAGRPGMLWLDCFGGRPLALAEGSPLWSEFDACLVSPELQGVPAADLAPFVSLARRCRWLCTKRADDWLALLALNPRGPERRTA